MMSETPSPFLKLAEIQGRGRSLVASQPIKAGQIILQDSPILVYPSSLSSSFCSHCFRNLNLTPSSSHVSCPCPCPCPNLTTLFCSPACLSSSSHSPWLCNSLKSLLLHSSLPPHLHTQALFLLFAFNLASLSPTRFSLLLSLEGDSSPDPSEALLLHSFISSLSPPPLPSAFSLDLTAALLAKDWRNAFGLMEPFSGSTADRFVRAYAIYPTASFFNHDCLPNACRFDYVDSVVGNDLNNTDIIVRAIHDIEQGREVCLSYLPVNASYRDRQRRLLEDYGFLCDCDRCQVEKNWRDDDDDDERDERMEEDEGDGDFPHAYFFVRYMCQRDNCGGTLAPLPPTDGALSNTMECHVCGQLTKEEDQHEEDEAEDGNMLDE